jgi:glyoxylase-like metal-dependent hydrolase (beta-lactamase superfamily II)
VKQLEKEMVYGEDYLHLPMTSLRSGSGVEVKPDIYCHTIQIVNIGLIGQPKERNWVLVDAGMPGSANDIIAVAEKRFGIDNPPKGIVLTHGHFDHVGAIIQLIEYWNIPVYAHELELPYLTGQKNYAPPDPSVDGMVAKMSLFFPNTSIDLGQHVKQLPSDGTIPIVQDWRWIHTPGHTPGHISLFRDKDCALIVGDAFVTVKQESLYKVFVQEQEISGPPKYFTPDWESARKSVKKLVALHPLVALTGHGLPMAGEELTTSLQLLVHEFDRIAMP